MDKEKQIEEIKDIILSESCKHECERKCCYCGALASEEAKRIYNAGYRNCKDMVVLSRKEYEEYQSFKNGDYCATKCDIHELSFNQMNIISNLKNEIKNSKEILEDRERFRARNEELKRQLENKSKETAEKILNLLVPDCKVCDENWHSGCLCLRATLAEKIAKQFNVEIKE